MDEYSGPAGDGVQAAGHSVTATGVVARGPQAYAGLLPHDPRPGCRAAVPCPGSSPGGAALRPAAPAGRGA
eukprot:876499-Alexandrium_andersonii.AAC.1